MEDFEIRNGELIRYTGPGGEVTVPAEVTIIGQNAFANCTNLKKVTLPEGLTKIAADAFKNCTNLENLEIPAKVKTVGAFAFVNCTSLDLTVRGKKTKFAKMAVIDLDCRMIIFAPEGSTAQAYAEEKGLTFIALDE